MPPATPTHPHPHQHIKFKPHLDLVFIVSFFTLISMLTPLSAPVHSATFICCGQPNIPQTPPPGQLLPSLQLVSLLVSKYQHPLKSPPPSAPPATPTHPHPHQHIKFKPHLDLVFIVSFFTLISMLTPLSAPVHSATFICYAQPNTPQTTPVQLLPSL